MSIEEEVLALVHRAPRAPEDAIPGGASLETIEAFEARLGRPIPSELRAWLLRCNCPPIGPGGLFGLCPENDYLDIEAHYRLHPLWREKGWIPVAGDGCGDYYVLDLNHRTRSGHPILFLDWENSIEDVCDTTTYVVASSLWPFLRYILLAELKSAYDLWDEREALREDPGLADDVGVPRPWEA